MPDPASIPGLIAAGSADLLAARNQTAFTLGFHIVIACFGVAFPAIMLVAEYRGRRHGDADALLLARRWSKVTAVLFAVGAVTGTVLSFELGLLWPGLFDRFGDAFGIGFAIEGLFFFCEAIFIAIYIYGWERLGGWAHFWSGVPIVLSGIGGAFSVVAANSWMNEPAGITLGRNGELTDTNPIDVLFNGATGYEFPHMLLAAYMVCGFLVASVYAVGMLRGRRDRYHRLGLIIPLSVAALATPVQLFVGDVAAREVADAQPAKFAALACVYETGPDQPEHIGGICTDGEVKGAISIPGLNSILVGFSTDTVVQGLDRVPPDERPPANTLLHLAFDTMVAIGTALLGLGVWFAIAWWRRRELPRTPWFLRAVAVSGVAAVVALECGWIVTEVGRQPWIVYGLMRTEDAVTDADGLWAVYGLTVGLYVVLGVATVAILRSMSRRWREEDEPAVPYGPADRAEAGA
jgi:cytochrome d ubiquinol oxidase subunit I